MSELTPDIKRRIIKEFLDWCGQHDQYGFKWESGYGAGGYMQLMLMGDTSDDDEPVDEDDILDVYFKEDE